MAANPTIGFARANADADTVVTLYVRDDNGRIDLTGAPAPELAVAIRAFGASTPVKTFPATGDNLGKVTFTVTAADVKRDINPGVYAYRLTANGVQMQSGVLEVAA